MIHQKPYLIPVLLFLFSSIIFWVTQSPIPTNGDTYLYALGVVQLKGPLFHIGYYFIGNIFNSALSVIYTDPVKNLGLMSLFSGSLSVVWSYLFTKKLTGNIRISLIVALTLLFSGGLWYYSAHGEVYVPQLSMVFISILMAVYNRPLLSSLAFLVAVSITPTSGLIFPALIYLIIINGKSRREIFYFLLPVIIIFLFLLIIKWPKIIQMVDDAVFSPDVFFTNFSYSALFREIFLNLSKVYIKSFNFLILFTIPGAFYLYRNNKRILFLVICILLPFSLYIFNLGLLTEDHLIITFIPVSLIIAFGVISTLDIIKLGDISRRILILLLLCAHGFLSYQIYIGPELRNSAELEKVMTNFSRDYENDGIMISEYNFGMAFWYYTQKENDYFLRTGRPNLFLDPGDELYEKKIEQLKNKFWINLSGNLVDFFTVKLKDKSIFENRPVYFVDRSDWPSAIVKNILPERQLRERENKIRKIDRFSDYLASVLNSRTSYLQIYDSPLHPIYQIRLLDPIK
ncbi:MAG: hypothetical protein AB7T22_11110 [Calditrichaceae bacterium]